MTLIVMKMSSPGPFKRSYDATNPESSLPLQDSGNASSVPNSEFGLDETSRSAHVQPETGGMTLGASPAQVSMEISCDGSNGSNDSMLAPGQTPPPKRRKLTASERESTRISKEAKEREKAKARAMKEEDKRIKDEQRKLKKVEDEQRKKIREDEKAERMRAKETEKALKEEEKRKKEEEKRAKEEAQAKKEKVWIVVTGSYIAEIAQSQLRLNAFFGAKAAPAGSSTSSRRSSIASIDESRTAVSSRGTSEAPLLSASDYEKSFPPFFLHAHTTVAPHNRYAREDEATEWAAVQVGVALLGNETQRAGNRSKRARSVLREAFRGFRSRDLKRQDRRSSVKEIVARIHGSAAYPIDLTSGNATDSKDPLQMLHKVPVKFLKYTEDVRPPYIGTYSKAPVEHSISKLCRNPFSRALPAVNYDYDSEAEWEEPEEGEELNSEGEEEGDDEDDEDMAGFLDDEDVDAPKRRNLMGDVEPVCTGLLWEPLESEVPYGKTSLNLKAFKMDSLLGKFSLNAHVFLI